MNERERGLSRPFFSFPNLPSWGDFEERMGQWFGKDTGVSVSEDNEKVYVEAQLPGLQADDIDISLDRNTLRISGEKKEEEEDKEKKYYRRAQSSFFYQVDLPSQVQEGSEKADYQDGVLSITFNKARKEIVKKIPISSSAQKKQAIQQKNPKQK